MSLHKFKLVLFKKADYKFKVSKSSLPTDNLVTLLAVGAPILLISFALLFSPNLATEDGLRCD